MSYFPEWNLLLLESPEVLAAKGDRDMVGFVVYRKQLLKKVDCSVEWFVGKSIQFDDYHVCISRKLTVFFTAENNFPVNKFLFRSQPIIYRLIFGEQQQKCKMILKMIIFFNRLGSERRSRTSR